MERLEGHRTEILLHLYERQNNEIERRERREQKLFEWMTGLLLAAFAAIIALSDRKEAALPHAEWIKILTTIMIAAPVYILGKRLRRYSEATVENAEAVDRIEELLRVFEPNYFGPVTPYPPEWEKKRVEQRQSRTTPASYLIILFLMTACVIASVWLLLGAQPAQRGAGPDSQRSAPLRPGA